MILEIVSPEATLFSGEVTSVSVPGINGEFQMLNNHAAVVSIITKRKCKNQCSSFNIDKEFTKLNLLK
jgi:F-type H+-transporting ATPase subunit epsilon